MQQTRLPEHPAAQEEYLHLQQVRDAIEREIGEVEALTGAKAGVDADRHSLPGWISFPKEAAAKPGTWAGGVC